MDTIATINSAFDRVAFEDTDRFAEFVKELDWSLESTQVSPGAYKLEFETIGTPELSVSRMTTRQSLSDYFSVPDDSVVFSIARSKKNATWNGKQLPPTTMGIYLPGMDHWAVLPADWDCYEVSMTESLARLTGLLPEAFFEKSSRPEHTCLPLFEPASSRLIAQLDAFFALARKEDTRHIPAIPVSELADVVVQLMAAVFDAGTASAKHYKLAGARRADLVRRAADFVESRLESQISMQDLAAELKVSARVLNYAFKDNLGISPHRYILTRKLHGVRQQLKITEEPVVEVISRYGFSTPSRFGRQYKQLFGESPSAVRLSR